MKKNYKKRAFGLNKGFGVGRPEPVPDDASVPAGVFEGVLYDKDRGLKLRLETTTALHPGELVTLFAEEGAEAGLDYDTLQGTVKSLDSGWLLTWVPPGEGEKELQKKLGERWEPVLEAQS